MNVYEKEIAKLKKDLKEYKNQDNVLINKKTWEKMHNDLVRYEEELISLRKNPESEFYKKIIQVLLRLV